MLTYLAVIFVIALVAFVLYGFGIIMRRPISPAQQADKCSLCQVTFEKTRLVERRVGDSKILYFCAACIQKLQQDLNKTAG